MNDNVTIQESYTLPSKGLVYKQKFNPVVKLRSMTVAEEMKRLTATEYPYKAMSEIIESCLLTELPISVYDMCLGDYQYLLHKLRVVTYGSEYDMAVACPYCGEIFDEPVDLDLLEVFEYTDDIEDLKIFNLPITGSTIEIKFQTPRDLDNIDKEKKSLKKKFPDMKDDPTLMLNLESIIDTVDGKTLSTLQLREFIKKLPLKDSSLILKHSSELNDKVGIDTQVMASCPQCARDVNTSFRFTSKFFRPDID